MKKLILILLLIIPVSSFANSVYAGLYTTHFYQNEKFNNKNSLVGVSVNNFHLTSFVNSQNVQSYFLGHEKQITKASSIIYGLSYGYNSDCFAIFGGTQEKCTKNHLNKEILPIATLKIEAKKGPLSISLLLNHYAMLVAGIHF